MGEQVEMPVSNRLVTAEEFERIPDEPGVRMELVDGRIVRMSPPGYRHGEVATRILTLLIAHADRENLGRVVMPVGFRIASNPDSVRDETVTVYRPGVGSVTLSAGDTIDGADVLPGFECDVRRFFE